MEKVEDKNLHKFKIEDGEIILDNFKIKGLAGFKIEKSSASSPTELLIKVIVED